MTPPEQIKRELVRQWLDKGEEDFGLIRHLTAEQYPYVGAIGFHAQQAAEKFLKALLVRHQIEFPKTHNLGELLDLIAATDAALADSLRNVTALNPYGVDTRYPGDFLELTPADAKEAVELASRTRDAVRSALKDYIGNGPSDTSG